VISEEVDEKYDIPEIEFNLDEKKKKIKDNLRNVVEPSYQSDVLAHIIGGVLEKKTIEASKVKYESAKKIAEENAKKERENDADKDNIREDLTVDDEIFDWSRAIIFAQISKNA